MNIQGNTYNFDRIVRLTLWYGNENGTTESEILEYAPLANSALCPHIEATVKDIANPNRKNNRPGFTAEIKVLNPTDGAKRLLAEHSTWMLQFANAASQEELEKKLAKDSDNVLRKYYESRIRVKLEVGYWNHEANAPQTDSSVSDARRQYKVLFHGFVNNSVRHRQGSDEILVMSCHDFDAGAMSVSAVTKAITGKRDVLAKKEEARNLTAAQREKRSSRGVQTWDGMLRKIVRNFINVRPNPAQALAALAPTIPVTEAARQNASWINVRYIFTPSKKNEINYNLEKRLNKINMNGFFAYGLAYPEMINELATFKNANIDWLQDDEWEKGKVTIFVWPKGKGIDMVPGNDADIKIVNYQNLIESPSVDASGALQIRMFLNLECIPLRRLALLWDETIGAQTGTGESLVVAGTEARESISYAGAPNPYVATNQGAYAQSIYMQQQIKKEVQNNGYLLNTGFPIVSATHTISTHGKKWETIVKTIPMWEGILLSGGDL